jgi:hypothetical protein
MGLRRLGNQKFADSPVEENGFELSVPSENPGFDLRTLQVQGERGSQSRTPLKG